MKNLIIAILFFSLFTSVGIFAKEVSEIKKTQVNITLPNLQMIRQDGKKIQIADEINDGRAVVVSFVYTSCSAICPMISQTISRLQSKLGADNNKVHLVSISLDPEHDTPKQLAAYAEKFHAGNFWQHYTGTEYASITLQKAMGVYRGDKMNHVPVTLLKSAKSDKWIRLDGFVSTEDLLSEIQGL
jgi:protein SCO1/2